VSSEHCIASSKLAPVALLVSAPALARSFPNSEINYLPIVGPVELWATRLRTSKRSGKSTGLLLANLDPPWPDNASSPLDHRAIRRRVGWTN